MLRIHQLSGQVNVLGLALGEGEEGFLRVQKSIHVLEMSAPNR